MCHKSVDIDQLQMYTDTQEQCTMKVMEDNIIIGSIQFHFRQSAKVHQSASMVRVVGSVRVLKTSMVRVV